ncbi:hypothetical protein Taro_053871, partial [Colocasia esculenta]|nr:hypothetical protein [Colocasia esculenta]
EDLVGSRVLFPFVCEGRPGGIQGAVSLRTNLLEASRKAGALLAWRFVQEGGAQLGGSWELGGQRPGEPAGARRVFLGVAQVEVVMEGGQLGGFMRSGRGGDVQRLCAVCEVAGCGQAGCGAPQAV